MEDRSGKITCRLYPPPFGVTVMDTRPSSRTPKVTDRHRAGGRSMADRMAAVSSPMAALLVGTQGGELARRHFASARSSDLVNFPRWAAASTSVGARLGTFGACP